MTACDKFNMRVRKNEGQSRSIDRARYRPLPYQCNNCMQQNILSKFYPNYVHYLRSWCVHARYYTPAFSTEHVFTSYATNMRPSTCINVTDVAAMWGVSSRNLQILYIDFHIFLLLFIHCLHTSNLFKKLKIAIIILINLQLADYIGF